MSAAQLVVALRSAGLTVVEDPGWDTRGIRWAAGKPIGQMEHHTAPPVPYPVPRLNGSTDGRVKCNQNIKPDGVVVMVAYLACNYASGPGSDVVYKETLDRRAPPANAVARNLTDNMVGNQFYWNIENDAPGDGSSLPQVQYDAIVTSARVVNQHFGLVPAQVVSHAEWTRRKIDPYWNNSTRTVAQIRLDLEDDMPTVQEIVAGVWGAQFGSGSNRQSAAERLAIAASGASAAANNTAIIIDMLKNLTGTDLQAVANAVNDEADRRARERLGTG